MHIGMGTACLGLSPLVDRVRSRKAEQQAYALVFRGSQHRHLQFADLLEDHPATAPRISLALHEYGIRYRRKTFRFDELLAIRYERESRGLEAVLLAVFQLLGKFRADYRQLVELIEAGNASSLTVVLKDGRACRLRGIALLCEPEDFEHFMRVLGNGRTPVVMPSSTAQRW